MNKTLKKYKENILYPGLLRRKFAARVFRKFGGRFIVYTAFPKSASQYLVALIGKVFENTLKIVRAKSGPGLGHSFISEEKLIRDLHYRKDILLYGHIPCFHSNLRILKKFTPSPKIIISVRPLADIMISYKEHVDKLGHGPLDYYTTGLSECHPEWQGLNDELKFDFLIQYILPWYVRFTTGWLEVAKKIPTEFITFEEHTLFPIDCLKNIIVFIDGDSNSSAIEKLNTIDIAPATNYNKGISGRGFLQLKPKQLDKINELVTLCGDRFCNTFLGQYLLHGYKGLPLKPEEVIERKKSSQQSLDSMFLDST